MSEEFDHGVERILASTASLEDQLREMTHLARHRGKCMDNDREQMGIMRVLRENDRQIICNLERQNEILCGNPLVRWLVWINDWAKS